MQQITSKQFTYQTRIKTDKDIEDILSEYANLFSYVERKLFVDFIKGKKLNALKKEYLLKYEITARQFNSIKFQLEGKIKSTNEIKKNQITDLKQKIKHLKKAIPKYKNPFKIHQKKRRLNIFKQKLIKLENHKHPKICFGSKKLFNAQFYLKENGYKNIEEWKQDWQDARRNSFFIIGSKDETMGNQSCQLIEEKNKLALKIRLPNKFLKYDKYLIIKDLEFAYGQNNIKEALLNNLRRNQLFKQKNASYKNYGKAINYRFIKDKKGFRVFVTIAYEESTWVTRKENGVIGIDINSDHLAVVETDRFLNPILSKRVPLTTYGKNKNQSLALIGDVTAKIIEIAKLSKKPIVLEDLDFQKKKNLLRESSRKQARMLSSFSYKSIIEMIKSKAFRSQIEVFDVNAAFTSVIGRVKFQKRYGFTNHQAAALTIARRYMQGSEKPPQKCYIFAKKSMRAFFLPVRNRKKHLWSFWGKVFGILKAVDAPHFRATNSRSKGTLRSAFETEILENYERDSHTLMSVDKTARSTSLKKSLLYV